ncbi:MAG: hypothetical protein SPJ75_04680 [Candidatus Onthomorpha sp.]|nr:hypothetical protein [Bacteroidales bacterium]MDD7590373.1 hypothetical protein [Bacteroidales bacterium]MDY5825778.1 hypothetical protein [Candidatus Onthomorpha sp.]
MNNIVLRSKDLHEAHNDVLSDDKYGKEYRLIEDVLKKYPNNKTIEDVACKIAVIDFTNSTNLRQNKINLYTLAKIITNIDFDAKVAKGDVSLVSDIISKCPVKLYSFASKYCCYHNTFLYNKDDYSIYDSVVKKHLPEYATEKLPASKWRKNFNYETFNQYIGDLLDEYGITAATEPQRRRLFDHYVWYKNRKSNNNYGTI